MKCKIPNQEAGTTRVYLGAVMSEHYEPPGKEVQTDDDGVKYVDVVEEVGKALIQNYGYEEYDEQTDDTENNINHDYSN